MMGEPWALTASMAMFTASWRDSNCAVRADDHRRGRVIKIKTTEIKIKGIPEAHFTCHCGIQFS